MMLVALLVDIEAVPLERMALESVGFGGMFLASFEAWKIFC